MKWFLLVLQDRANAIKMKLPRISPAAGIGSMCVSVVLLVAVISIGQVAGDALVPSASRRTLSRNE